MPEFQGEYVPENGLEYIIASNLKKNRLATSGSMTTTPMTVANAGYLNVQPFWGDLPGVFTDNLTGQPLNFHEIDGGNFSAPILNVENGWTREGVKDAFTMGDRRVIMEMLGKVSNFSIREINRLSLLISVAATAGANTDEWPTVMDMSDVGIGLAHRHITRALGMFGEQQDEVGTLWVHSDVQVHLDELNLISNQAAYPGQYMPYGRVGKLTLMVDNTLTPAVVEDDNGDDVNIYPMLLGAGEFFAYGDGSIPAKVAETDRDVTGDNDKLATRQRICLHTFGTRYEPVQSNRAATLAEVLDANNWHSSFENVETGGYPFRTALLMASLNDFEPATP
ncbi:hypothetical protein VCR14J2_390380 [Vibrio coralliirubri]|uniref:hypothetical protein n=1 Tax=Vibrio coralliirubri TaxID=1516159 RepID=UPI000638881C|nr:hypothetical protein [Vibrio coralliirubri]CDU05773.1 hypothetical protein VCR14J2_390380 [Vibrio coralliirubri]